MGKRKEEYGGETIYAREIPAETKSDFTKNDSGKLQWSLLPFEQLEDVVRVLMAGAKKYSRDNWKKCDDINRYKDSLMRHVTAYIEGNKFDSGLGGDNYHHLAHAICNCLFILYLERGEIAEWKKILELQMTDPIIADMVSPCQKAN